MLVPRLLGNRALGLTARASPGKAGPWLLGGGMEGHAGQQGTGLPAWAFGLPDAEALESSSPAPRHLPWERAACLPVPPAWPTLAPRARTVTSPVPSRFSCGCVLATPAIPGTGPFSRPAPGRLEWTSCVGSQCWAVWVAARGPRVPRLLSHLALCRCGRGHGLQQVGAVWRGHTWRGRPRVSAAPSVELGVGVP